MQLLVNFFTCPVQLFSILAHFKTGNGNTTGVDSLARSKDGLGLDEFVHSVSVAAHVRNFGNQGNLVGDQLLCIFQTEFVLGSARHGDIHFLFPRLLASEESSALELVGERSHNVVVAGTQFQHVVDLFLVEAFRIVNITVRTGNGHNLGTQLGSFGNSTPSHITETGDGYGLALDVHVVSLQHVFYEVNSTETGSFGTQDGTTPASTLAGQNAGVFTTQFLVHAVHVTDFAAANTYIASGNVGFRSDVFLEFHHESLAETHDFIVGTTFCVEVGTTLATAHRQCGQAVLECLFEAQELEGIQTYGGVETQTAFVRSNRVVELYTVTGVDLDFALVVNPFYTESEDTVRFNHTFDNLVLFILGMCFHIILDGIQHFLYSLEEQRFVRMFFLQISQDFFYVHGSKF